MLAEQSRNPLDTYMLEVDATIPEGAVLREDLIHLISYIYREQNPTRDLVSSLIFARKTVNLLLDVFEQSPEKNLSQKTRLDIESNHSVKLAFFTPAGIETILKAKSASTILSMASGKIVGWMDNTQLHMTQEALTILSEPELQTSSVGI